MNQTIFCLLRSIENEMYHKSYTHARKRARATNASTQPSLVTLVDIALNIEGIRDMQN